MWTKMHGYFRITHNLVLGIHQRTRIKFIQKITFSLSFKIFELCNFCFEMHYLFITKANSIAKREAFSLKSN
nr:MAG TPA: hypothetical protein [Caudoviricetes sp.]